VVNKKHDLQAVCAELVQEALARGSVDNVTVLIVSFHMPAPKEEKKE
jgi:serine/threonine protein phosphatase PrpC